MTTAEQTRGALGSWALRVLDADGARALRPASLFNLDNQVAVRHWDERWNWLLAIGGACGGRSGC